MQTPFAYNFSMKEIPLTRGKIALIDDEDFEVVSQYKWSAMKHGRTFYARTNIPVSGHGKQKQRTLRMHQLLVGKGRDHEDGDGLNNQRKNLRIATHRQNGANSRRPKNNTSGYKGATFHKATSKWLAQIKVDYKNIYLGVYSTPEEAAAAYDEAAYEHFEEFAQLNLAENTENI
jgi:hypothetical protein